MLNSRHGVHYKLAEKIMARRTKEDALKTREHIVDAAVTVFHERGVARPSLTDIAKLAGVTRGAIYGHFKNKADLVNALTARIRLPADTLCETDPERLRKDPLGELRSRWLELYTEVAHNREWQLILDIIFHRIELVTESGEIHQRMEEGRGTAIEHMRNMLQLAVEAGQLDQDLDIKLAAAVLHGALVGVLEDWLLQPDAYNLAKMGERNVGALFDMLRLSSALRKPT
ncbi:TetR family transcriptional regulator [Kineobactrum salinum]|uniref:TetR family transcriptional regulator n=1 Tax=Kineobactrum salinum TaxID=2708301 RepID=A0A6C0U433_9GAMM|nr:TetR family transcriptional regulator [Kineobactrum salinum]QIB65135.1 TetR family transcriptional regulator [Kineobactrum salinum]